MKEVCIDIEKRYQMKFLEIGTDKDHVHFLVQSIPVYSVRRTVSVIKSITAREIFKRCPQVKKQQTDPLGRVTWVMGKEVVDLGRLS